MAKINLINRGANKHLASVADVQHIVLDGLDVELVFSCDACGRVTKQRHVSQFALSQFLGWTTPESVETTFDSLASACNWLAAGSLPSRDQFDDEVDYMAARGDIEGRFRLAEMRASKAFDPGEFAKSVLLMSHAACDWGYSWPDSLNGRLDFWEVGIEEERAEWPEVDSEQFESAWREYVGMCAVLDEQFAAQTDDTHSKAFWAAVGIS